MKKIITLAMLLLSLVTFAQKPLPKEEIYFYVPLRTYHFDREYVQSLGRWMSGNEGGNIGLIITFRNNYEPFYVEKQIGVIRNSYGNASIIFQVGAGVRVIGLNIGLAGGIATNYREAYLFNEKLTNAMPDLFYNNAIIVQANLNISLDKGIRIGDAVEFSPMIVVTPLYINGGIKIKF